MLYIFRERVQINIFCFRLNYTWKLQDSVMWWRLIFKYSGYETLGNSWPTPVSVPHYKFGSCIICVYYTVTQLWFIRESVR